MNKIERIEQLLKAWKADEESCREHRSNYDARFVRFKIIGLEAALEILKEPSNTQMHMDSQKPFDHVCEKCGTGIYLDDYDATVCGCQ